MVCLKNCLHGTVSLPAPNTKKTEVAKLERNSAESLGLQWSDDPSQRHNNRNNQTGAKSPGLKHRFTEDPVCSHGLYNPYQVREELTWEGNQPREDVVGMAEEETKMHHKKHQEVQALIASHQISEDDTALAVTFVTLLKVCSKKKDLQEGSKIHIDIAKRGLLKTNVFVGSALLSMYAKCGVLDKAQEVFNELPAPNIVSWTALIAGYAEHGCGKEALECFERMQLEGFSPNTVTFACILKACGSIGALGRGQEIHAQICRERLLEQDIVVANALIDMYVKCGALKKAQEVFDELRVWDVVSCNTLIAGYAQHEHGKEALQCFDWMRLKGFSLNAATFASSLKACGSIGALSKGQEIHALLVKECMLGNDIVVAGAVVDMYAKCGALKKAQEVFDELPFWNVVLWNALIAGYVEYGNGEVALNCFKQMQLEGFSASAVTLTCILTACGSLGSLDKGQELHALIVREHLLAKDIVIASALVDMYAKCGALEKAQELLSEIPVRDMISWNVLIAGYAQHGHDEQALGCFEQLQTGGFSPDAFTFACILKACGSLGVADKGHKIHTQIIRESSLEQESMVANALVDMYARCGALENAEKVFDNLLVPDVVSWNSLIFGYVHHGQGEKAIDCFECMQLGGFSPNAVTFACTLKACGSMQASGKGQELHAQIVKEHLFEKDIVVANALIDMYAKCGEAERAQDVFDGLLVRDVVSWNALITGYAHHGHGEKAVNFFDRMQSEGSLPNVVTFACSLKACGSIRALEKGQNLHAQIVGERLLVQNVEVGAALVDMYAKCGVMKYAEDVFDELSARDVISWNILITGYAQNNLAEEAMSCFRYMQLEGFSSDAVTYACVLKACSSLGDALKGQRMHAEIVTYGLLDENVVVGTALVVLYANCGMLAEAQELFNRLPVQDVVSWSGLMEGYAQLGKDEFVLKLFNRMIKEGIEPSLGTFTVVLNACSHGGLLDKGQRCFESISKSFGIIPTLEHHTCMVNLFGCAGLLDKAAAVIQEMPLFADLTIWHTLLGVCKRWGNVNLGRWAFEHVVCLDEKDAAIYVCMSNIYASAGMQD